MWSVVKWWNRNTNFRPLLQSRVILYFLFFISLLTLYGFAMNGEFVYATIFIIVGFLTSFFSKNMIVILFLALAVTNIIIQGIRGSQGQREGLATKKPVSSEESSSDKDDEATESSSSSSSAKAAAPSQSPATKKTNASVNDEKSEKFLRKLVTDKDSENAAKQEIKNLLDLQLKLMTGVNGLQPILKDVESALSGMRNNAAFQ